MFQQNLQWAMIPATPLRAGFHPLSCRPPQTSSLKHSTRPALRSIVLRYSLCSAILQDLYKALSVRRQYVFLS